MEARCTHCESDARKLITYEDALGIQVKEATCLECADARSGRDKFDHKALTEVNPDF